MASPRDLRQRNAKPLDDGDRSSLSSSVGRASNIPPYWQAHQRTVSCASYTSVQGRRQPIPIVLQDNTGDQSESNKGIWAKGVDIDGYTLVAGPAMGAGSYVVWNCIIETIDVNFLAQ